MLEFIKSVIRIMGEKGLEGKEAQSSLIRLCALAVAEAKSANTAQNYSVYMTCRMAALRSQATVDQNVAYPPPSYEFSKVSEYGRLGPALREILSMLHSLCQVFSP